MSKYIRTKDGIYEIKENIMLTSLPPQYQRIDGKGIPQTEVIKQADAIEELCDEFVYINGNGTHYHWDQLDYEERKDLVFKSGELNGKRLFEVITLYGAIWTDKGLIYVAKMNNHCRLELLGGENDQ